MDLALATIESDHLTDAVLKMVPMRLRQKIDLMHAKIHAAGRDFVQQRLPQMSTRLVDQGDIRPLPASQRVAEPRDKFQPASTAADNNDPMEICTLARHCTLQVRRLLVGPADFYSAANFVIVGILA